MNVLLWTLQVLLAVAFLAHGWLFVSPPPEMVDQMNASISPALRIFIGGAEMLAAIGLTLPGVTRIAPSLVPTAAGGLMIVMIAATIYHLARAEYGSAIATSILLVVVTFVAYMRWKIVPIRSRERKRAVAA